MLSVRLTHRLGDFKLDVSFEAPQGITVLFGRSGTGKTSIANAVAGLLQPEQGRIRLGNRELLNTGTGICLPPHKRRVGYIFQEDRLFPHLSVQQNLMYGRRFAGPASSGTSVEQVIELLGIGDFLNRRPGMLSGGEKQRVAIGRALLADPEILVADEPLSALDEERKSEIIHYFEKLRDEFSVPVLYVSHSVAEVSRLATTVVTLQNGKVSAQGPAHALLSDPAVTPLGVRAAGALISARLVAHHPDGLSELNADGNALFLPRVDYAPGTTLRVRIDAQDVMLALRRPESISALNVIPARLTHLRRGEGPGVLAHLDAGGTPILARITRRSADQLALEPGLKVFAIIKAVSVPRDAISDQVVSE